VTVTSRVFKGESPAAVVRAAVDSVAAGDYVAFLSYLPASLDVETAVADAREAITARTHAASTYGVGPRYLHSTGQYHKGGPNTVVAFVLTADDATETAIPEAGYSFAVLKRAQALGDVETLQAHERRVLRIHFKRSEAAADDFGRLFTEALA
jgi:hypothetical protein